MTKTNTNQMNFGAVDLGRSEHSNRTWVWTKTASLSLFTGCGLGPVLDEQNEWSGLFAVRI